MKLITNIGYTNISISEDNIEDVYFIEKTIESEKFYIWSKNGYSTLGILEFYDLEKAIKYVKKLIKNYFIDRANQIPITGKIIL